MQAHRYNYSGVYEEQPQGVTQNLAVKIARLEAGSKAVVSERCSGIVLHPNRPKIFQNLSLTRAGAARVSWGDLDLC